MHHQFNHNGCTSLTLTPQTTLEEALFDAILAQKEIVIERLPGAQRGIIITQAAPIKSNAVGELNEEYS